MAQPLSTEPLSTVHAREGDIITLGRWINVQINPRTEGTWQFQQFDVVLTSGESDETNINRDDLEALHSSGEWGAFAIKRPQTSPPKLQPVEVDESEEAPTDS